MRPIRFIFVLLTVAAALVLALLRPLPGKAATRHAAGHPHERKAKKLRRERHVMARPVEPTGSFGHRVVKYAKQFLGVRYTYGGSSPSTGFDCSGFVRYVYGHFGISLPHSSFADLWRGRRVAAGHLRPGDLLFFDGGSHVGIYVGDGRFIDAPHTGAVVRISTLSWYGGYSAARRLRGA